MGMKGNQLRKKKWESHLPKTDVLRMTSVTLFERIFENTPFPTVKWSDQSPGALQRNSALG